MGVGRGHRRPPGGVPRRCQAVHQGRDRGFPWVPLDRAGGGPDHADGRDAEPPFRPVPAPRPCGGRSAVVGEEQVAGLRDHAVRDRRLEADLDRRLARAGADLEVHVRLRSSSPCCRPTRAAGRGAPSGPRRRPRRPSACGSSGRPCRPGGRSRSCWRRRRSSGRSRSCRPTTRRPGPPSPPRAARIGVQLAARKSNANAASPLWVNEPLLPWPIAHVGQPSGANGSR